MNIRKNIDYTAMHVRISDVMHAGLSQMERYFAIGQAVAERPEKGAAVAAAEYIQKNWPDEKGYSPRNLRRMRELYRVYGDCSEAITLAEQIGWTQNVVILEAELDLDLRLWYMRAAHQFGWSKLDLVAMIQNEAHKEIVMDNGQEVGENEDNKNETKSISMKDTAAYYPASLLQMIRRRCRWEVKIDRCIYIKIKLGTARMPITSYSIFQAKRTAFVRC